MLMLTNLTVPVIAATLGVALSGPWAAPAHRPRNIEHYNGKPSGSVAPKWRPGSATFGRAGVDRQECARPLGDLHLVE
jgi:hypothetical protein